MMVKKAAADRKSGRLFVFPCFKTIVGGCITGTPILQTDAKAPQSHKGELVLQAITAYREGVPHPTQSEWKTQGKELYRAAGVRSWRAYVKGTESVDIFIDGDVMVLSPCTNRGPKGGFAGISDKDIEIPADSSAETIGEALDAALDACE